MRVSITITTLLFCCMAQLALAQYREAPDGFSFRLAAPNHRYPISNKLERTDFDIGLEFEYLRHLNKVLNLSVPLRLVQTKIPVDGSDDYEDGNITGIDLLLHLKYCQEPKFLYPHIFGGLGLGLHNMSDVAWELPVGVGLNLRLNRHFYFTTKLSYRLALDDYKDYIQAGAGFLFIIGPGAAQVSKFVDTDGDGLQDDQDLCPDLAGPRGLNGCPDSDGDGVTDGDDRCPTVAGLQIYAGCPDSDGDGVVDDEDECPNEPGLAVYRGCPLRDADGDGVTDENDACPNQPGTMATRGCPDGDGDGITDQDDLCPDAAGPAATGGCPDSDGDGVIDRDDRCPNTAGIAANNGCPEIRQEDQETLEFAMSAVQFETASANLKIASNTILNEIAEIMKRYPDYKLRISGHTDSIGSSAPNQALSEKRARTCYEYLIGKGISAARVSYAGYGESQPIADNRYKAGREKNRRVEFELYLE